MGEFFAGWRPKIGLVTLMMACVFTGLWIRGRYCEDWRFLKFGSTVYLLRSDHGGFSCNKWNGPLPTAIPLGGTQLGQNITQPPGDFFFYYSDSAIPLTALAAYLLLTKPRKANQKKITEPIQGEGGGAAS